METRCECQCCNSGHGHWHHSEYTADLSLLDDLLELKMVRISPFSVAKMLLVSNVNYVAFSYGNLPLHLTDFDKGLTALE